MTVALRGFREGDRVKAVVLGIEKNRISLSLRPSHFEDGDFEDNADADAEEHPNREVLGVMDEDEEMDGSDAEALSDSMGSAEGDEDDNGDSDDDDAMQIDIGDIAYTHGDPKSAPTPAVPAPSLKLSGGFQWSGSNPQSNENPDSNSSSESETEGQPKKKKKKRKEIEQDLTADMHTKAPESTADFERLLLGSPNSSYLWVQYMAFLMQLSEIDKARETARRALKTINFREEQEKLNVWIALLNLENLYGTDETLEETFKEAARANDSKTIHLRLASIFDTSEKFQVGYNWLFRVDD